MLDGNNDVMTKFEIVYEVLMAMALTSMAGKQVAQYTHPGSVVAISSGAAEAMITAAKVAKSALIRWTVKAITMFANAPPIGAGRSLTVVERLVTRKKWMQRALT